MTETPYRYSAAARCATCARRAVLTGDMAAGLARVSRGRLGVFTCPDGNGWHVWNPDVEQPAPDPLEG